MEDTDEIPRYSYDLIDMLDECFPKPELPNTVSAWVKLYDAGIYDLAFRSGVRSVVDNLIRMRAEQEEAHGGPPSEDPDALPGDSGTSVVGPDKSVREIAVGGADPVEFRVAKELPHKDPVGW